MESRIEGETARERRHQVLDLHALDKWEDILDLYQYDKENHNTEIWDRGLLWLRPSERSLQFIAEQLQNLGLKKILSVGCGSGLFEWLISRVTGLHVEGLEVDAKWWNSPYSPPCFLPKNQRHFVIPGENSDELIPKDVALLFCYFNDEEAYNDYLKRFLGNCIIVAGPAGVGDTFPADNLIVGDSKELAKKGRHCNPKPFSVKEPWVLVKAMAVDTSPGMVVCRKEHLGILNLSEVSRNLVKTNLIYYNIKLFGSILNVIVEYNTKFRSNQKTQDRNFSSERRE